MVEKKYKFLDYFPNHVYRYIDQTGESRPVVVSEARKDELNVVGYESYFTVNGFKNQPNAKKEHCTNINAFFVDIDGRKDLAELEAIKARLDPTFIVETKNGHHVYWLLDEPLYKEDGGDWNAIIARWERIEQSIVDTLKGDDNAKDLCRILRVPGTYYWKKSEGAYKKGLAGVFRIAGKYMEVAHRYSMDRVEEVFPYVAPAISAKTPERGKDQKTDRNDFFRRMNEMYPLPERPSFQKLVSGAEGTLPPDSKSRNTALLITCSLMKQAGWTKEQAVESLEKTGWHGIEKERGGWQEIMTTVNSAFNNNYTYSYRNEVIAWNMTPEEQSKIHMTFNAVAKERKEVDKLRFETYEWEIYSQHPYFRKNEVGIVFDYKNGVYKMLTDLELDSIVFNGLYDDMLWGFRTKTQVANKVACLLGIIPDLAITDDKGRILNVQNGLLDIYTKELKPHTPEFVSLVQSAVSYTPEAKCPIWDNCIEAWMEGPEKEDKKILLQQFSGYCLSSSMQYDRALFLIGDGGNGKSTFVDTISMVLGRDSVSHIDLESLYGQYGMKGLIGKRLNIIEEVHGNYYQSNKLKKVVSGEKVTIDIKYKDQFSFRPQAKFIFAVNIMPRVDDTSTATERRIAAIIFRNNFRINPNVDLRSEMGLLATELPGVLNWMLVGATVLKERKNFINTNE
jgi:P4 family phage/plasmid primase-like protien